MLCRMGPITRVTCNKLRWCSRRNHILALLPLVVGKPCLPQSQKRAGQTTFWSERQTVASFAVGRLVERCRLELEAASSYDDGTWSLGCKRERETIAFFKVVAARGIYGP